MTKNLRLALSSLIAMLLVAAVAWALYFIAQLAWAGLSSVKPELAVAVVAGAATLLGSTLTVMLGRHFERRKDIEAHFRAEKIKIYDEFLCELFKVFETGGEASDEMVKFLRQWQRKLVLWGGSNVLAAYFKWMSKLKSEPDAQTVFLMDEFFRELRSDVGQNSTGLQRGAFAHLILRHADLFLEVARKQPHIKLSQLSALEKQIYGDQA